MNAFPWTYRQYSLMVDLLPVLNGSPDVSKRRSAVAGSGQRLAFLKSHTAEDDEKMTLLALGPLTTFVPVLEDYGPDFFAENYEIIRMGGAINPTPGNIDPGIAIDANPNAEWNACRWLL